MNNYEKYNAILNCVASTLILWALVVLMFCPEWVNEWWHILVK